MSENNSIKVGSVLLSEPYLSDPNFLRSVILVVDDTDGSHFGLVLNQPLDKATVSTLLNLDGLPLDHDVYLGGPVEQDSLHYIHKYGDRISGSQLIEGDLYYGGEFGHVKMLLELGELDPNKIRFFMGYSGWSPGQLEEEQKRNAWLLTNLEHLDVFEKDGNKLWQNVLRHMGGKYRVISNYPIDPNLN